MTTTETSQAVTYEEVSYTIPAALPTPRSRKIRKKNVKEVVPISLVEVTEEEAPVVATDTNDGRWGVGDIRLYDGKFYRRYGKPREFSDAYEDYFYQKSAESPRL